jgi:hypothetical protein
MDWSPDEVSAFLGKPVLQEQINLPHVVRFEDDLIWGELWVHAAEDYAIVMVRRPNSHQELVEFSVPCRKIATKKVSSGDDGLFFFVGDGMREEDCWLYITKDKSGRLAFYPAVHRVWDHVQST